MKKTHIDQRMHVAGIDFVIRNVPAVVRDEGRFVDEPMLKRLELLVADELARRGIATGEAFKFMRKAAGFKATEMAELLAVSPTTLSNWETGKTDVDRGAWAAVADEVAERLGDSGGAARYLRAALEPKRVKRVELQAAPMRRSRRNSARKRATAAR